MFCKIVHLTVVADKSMGSINDYTKLFTGSKILAPNPLHVVHLEIAVVTFGLHLGWNNDTTNQI